MSTPLTDSLGSSHGFTVIELLIVLAIAGILLAVGVGRFSSPDARAYANDVRALVQQARFEAIKRNAPIGVIWVADEEEFQSVVGSVATPCAPTSVLARASADDYRRVEVDPGFNDGDGIVWLPNGQARACDYSGFSETIAEIANDQYSRRVTVTVTGRVTIE